jgi:CubicO group peptidase (beta-lactamase class C family)
MDDDSEGPKYPESYTYTVPDANETWDTASLEDVGMNLQRITAAFNKLFDYEYGEIHSVLILKDDKLVLEEYFEGLTDFGYGDIITYSRDQKHDLASATKSITSILVGIAIDKGFITSIDNPIIDYFPKYEGLIYDDITIRHLLTMTAGFEWNEHAYTYYDPRNILLQLIDSDDPVDFIFSLPMENTPGIKYRYNGACTNLLGEIVKRTSGSSLDDFSEEYLFGPLGISDFEWDKIGDLTYASGGLDMRPIDLLKIGYLFLKNGIWDGDQIVTQNWISDSTSAQLYYPIGFGQNYGYQWWVGVKNYSARGWGDQFLWVFPDLDLIIVITAGNYKEINDMGSLVFHEIIQSIIDNLD